jgi:hypothetical protein
MRTHRHVARVQFVGSSDLPSGDEPTGVAADAADVPDSLGAAEPIQAISPAGHDEFASDVERADRRELGSVEALQHPAGSGGIPGFVESQALADEGDASRGDPWH